MNRTYHSLLATGSAALLLCTAALLLAGLSAPAPAWAAEGDAAPASSEEAGSVTLGSEPPDPVHMWSGAEGLGAGEEDDISTLSADGPYWSTQNGVDTFFDADGNSFASPAIKVIDVSHHQGTIDWEAYRRANPNGQVILRAGYGTDGVDRQFARNISEVKRLGIPYGVYLYSYAYDSAFAAQEAQYTANLLSQHGASPALGIFYDLEGFNTWDGHAHPTSPSVYEGILRAYVSGMVSRGWAESSIHVYSYTSYLNRELNSSYIHSKTTWVAQYGPRLKFDITATGQRGWQYTSTDRVTGIDGDVDASAFSQSGEIGRSLASLGTKVTDLADGDYLLVSALSGVGGRTNGVIDVDQASTQSGAGSSLYHLTAAANQVFHLSSNGDGSYQIKASHSGKVLDAAGPSYRNGTRIVQWDANGASNQKWWLYRDSAGYYYLASAYAGDRNKVIDVTGGIAKEGAVIELWAANGTDGQRFRLVPTAEYDSSKDGWITENGGSRWYDQGIRAEGKMILDVAAGQWYWAQPYGGAIAKNTDVFVPTNNGGKWIRTDDDGHFMRGEDYRYGGWYYFDPVTAAMRKGVVYVGSNGGKWVYYDVVNGQMAHGERYLSYDAEHTGWYLFDRYTGAMFHGDTWLTANGGKWVRYDRYTGKMVKGLQYQDGSWYYFDPVTGAMAHGRTWVPEWGKYVAFDAITGRG